jgi:hypothetical protein
MNDPINKMHNAARRASGYLDLGMKEQAIRELSTLMNDDDYIDQLYKADLAEEYFEQHGQWPLGYKPR